MKKDGEDIRLLISPLPSNTMNLAMSRPEFTVNQASVAERHSHFCGKSRLKENGDLQRSNNENEVQYIEGDIIEANFVVILQDGATAPPGHPARADSARESVFTGAHQGIIWAKGKNVAEKDVFDVFLCGTSHGNAYEYAIKTAKEDPNPVALIWRYKHTRRSTLPQSHLRPPDQGLAKRERHRRRPSSHCAHQDDRCHATGRIRARV